MLPIDYIEPGTEILVAGGRATVIGKIEGRNNAFKVKLMGVLEAETSTPHMEFLSVEDEMKARRMA